MGWVMNAGSVALTRCCLVFTSQILAAKSAAINPPLQTPLHRGVGCFGHRGHPAADRQGETDKNVLNATGSRATRRNFTDLSKKEKNKRALWLLQAIHQHWCSAGADPVASPPQKNPPPKPTGWDLTPQISPVPALGYRGKAPLFGVL